MNHNRAAPYIAFCVASILLPIAMSIISPAHKKQPPANTPDPILMESITVAAEIEIQETQVPKSDPSTPAIQQVQVEIFEPWDISLPVHLQRHTWSEARRIGIAPEILLKLMWRESGYQVDAWCIDSNGYESVGLCQINGIAFSWCEDRGIDPSTPEGNITAAAELISYYLTERGCNLEQALAAYGAGETGMRAGMGMDAARRLLEGELPNT